ncbi:hypothetical protein BJG92_03315 [Arthrobacter sp. SO5]|uniref:hypothetical protein n=1 Tax=Arthrobacter sp. SO5 TaxID=1897055 RepID=UPI001E4F826A|nr:hypothetical protein [Arthrobacter sp. SO5]MCB5275762.1 hypothetical protein [Arthrobacter sp. SO5]
MTELNPAKNHASDTDVETPDSGIDWPALPGSAAAQDPDVGGQDPAVGALMDRLGALPDLPVADHGEVYAGLHEELMGALNHDVTRGTAGHVAAGGSAE